jgi:hypothetical protein
MNMKDFLSPTGLASFRHQTFCSILDPFQICHTLEYHTLGNADPLQRFCYCPFMSNSQGCDCVRAQVAKCI